MIVERNILSLSSPTPIHYNIGVMKTKFQNNEESNHDEIRELAFLLWEQAGCPAGRDREFWIKAEEQIVMPHGLPPMPSGTTPKISGLGRSQSMVKSTDKHQKRPLEKAGKHTATK